MPRSWTDVHVRSRMNRWRINYSYRTERTVVWYPTSLPQETCSDPYLACICICMINETHWTVINEFAHAWPSIAQQLFVGKASGRLASCKVLGKAGSNSCRLAVPRGPRHMCIAPLSYGPPIISLFRWQREEDCSEPLTDSAKQACSSASNMLLPHYFPP